MTDDRRDECAHGHGNDRVEHYHDDRAHGRCDDGDGDDRHGCDRDDARGDDARVHDDGDVYVHFLAKSHRI